MAQILHTKLALLWDIRKIDEQGYGLARKEHQNVVKVMTSQYEGWTSFIKSVQLCIIGYTFLTPCSIAAAEFDGLGLDRLFVNLILRLRVYSPTWIKFDLGST